MNPERTPTMGKHRTIESEADRLDRQHKIAKTIAIPMISIGVLTIVLILAGLSVAQWI